MAKIKFTVKSITDIKPGPKRIEYFDNSNRAKELKGSFGVRVLPTGTMTWFIMYHNRYGKVRRFNVGSYPDISLARARNKSETLLIQIDEDGYDPMEDRREKRTQKPEEAKLMSDLWDLHCEERKRKPRSASHMKQERSFWRRIVGPTIGRMRIQDVSYGHLDDMLEKYAKKAPVGANRMHGFLGMLFKPAVKRRWLKHYENPALQLDKPREETPKSRRLKDTEIRTLWPYFDLLPTVQGDVFKLGLYTCQRPGEIVAMRWKDVDLEKGIWEQETNKTDVPFLCPLAPQVVEILKARYESRGEDDVWVFTNPSSSSGHAEIPASGRRKLKEWSGITDWTNHDLRRTGRTLLSGLEVPHHIRERCLNHSVGKIEGTYDLFDYHREKRAAFVKLANKVDRIVGKEQPAKQKIVDIKRAS